MLPFTGLRRYDRELAQTKADVLVEKAAKEAAEITRNRACCESRPSHSQTPRRLIYGR